uniref:Uncharacterized protein n=1 Tax=Anguilla anguilla TaxID=7936 RepID=A0A0E9QUZ8_ANGAN
MHRISSLLVQLTKTTLIFIFFCHLKEWQFSQQFVRFVTMVLPLKAELCVAGHHC